MCVLVRARHSLSSPVLLFVLCARINIIIHSGIPLYIYICVCCAVLFAVCLYECARICECVCVYIFALLLERTAGDENMPLEKIHLSIYTHTHTHITTKTTTSTSTTQ